MSLEKISIINYKCHKETEIALRPMTLLVGTNSSGKSSVIQSLLLAVHNATPSLGKSALNGHLVSIGNFSEARNLITNAKSFEIGIAGQGEELNFEFFPTDDKLENADSRITRKSQTLNNYLDYSNKNVHYLSAHRIGGQDLYVKNFDNYDMYGLNGEYAIDYYQHHKSSPIDEFLIKNPDSDTLESQVNYWLEYIFDHTIATSALSGTDKVKSEYILKTGKSIRPKNIGSGISFVISIVIICLSSKKGDLIIIENPEIHLHPKAQSMLTEFFVLIANSGRQLVIESHSDHIFNGLRVSLYNKIIKLEDLSINFFTLAKDTFLTVHTTVKLNDQARILNGQDLLFDQFDNDINALLDIF